MLKWLNFFSAAAAAPHRPANSTQAINEPNSAYFMDKLLEMSAQCAVFFGQKYRTRKGGCLEQPPAILIRT